MIEKLEVQETKENLPESLDTNTILSKINAVTTREELKEITELFNLNITKKEMTRAIKQDELLDLILKQTSERLEKRPDELSTRDLLDYMNAFQSNLDKTQSMIEKVETSPTIQINQNHQDVIVNVGDLSRDSTENVLDAIKELLNNIESSGGSLGDILDSVQTIDVTNVKENQDD